MALKAIIKALSPLESHNYDDEANPSTIHHCHGCWTNEVPQLPLIKNIYIGKLYVQHVSCIHGFHVTSRSVVRICSLEISGNWGAFRVGCSTLFSEQRVDSTYYSDLTRPECLRYAEKLEMCDSIDSFTLGPGRTFQVTWRYYWTFVTNTSPIILFFPIISWPSSKGRHSSRPRCAIFSQAVVTGTSAKQLQDDKVLLLGYLSCRLFFYLISKNETTFDQCTIYLVWQFTLLFPITRS